MDIHRGIITLFFSFMIVFYPLFGIFNIIIWTGLSFIFAGISSFIYAFVGRGKQLSPLTPLSQGLRGE